MKNNVWYSILRPDRLCSYSCENTHNNKHPTSYQVTTQDVHPEQTRYTSGEYHMQDMVTAAATAASGAMGMQMTHYMELLATNQPWNLIIFMAIPVILAEALTATEFLVLLKKEYHDRLRPFNRIIGIVLGIYFTGIFVYLITNVYPSIQWRSTGDFIAVNSYLSGVFFLAGIALLELGIIAKKSSDEKKEFYHVMLLIGFLIVAHVAMIFGMLNPSIF